MILVSSFAQFLRLRLNLGPDVKTSHLFSLYIYIYRFTSLSKCVAQQQAALSRNITAKQNQK